jgi:prepilin-type N-terminal cleavage/methylation domain-containing protein/prepilin-type processing-associated H-X9-DG protein
MRAFFSIGRGGLGMEPRSTGFQPVARVLAGIGLYSSRIRQSFMESAGSNLDASLLLDRPGTADGRGYATHGLEARTTGFTLVELLVVIGIISVLIAMLLPALNKARQQAKVVACGSQERQIAMALLMYANDNKGWFPKTFCFGGQGIIKEEAYGQSGPDYDKSPIAPYLKSSNVLKCPAQSDVLKAAHAPYYASPTRFLGSYRIIAAHAGRANSSSVWYGWLMYTHSTGANDYRAPIPNVNWTGRTMRDPDTGRAEYVDTSDQQPMLMDCFDAVDKLWYGFSVDNIPNNHYGLGGENVAFIDGHVEWRRAKLINGALSPDSQVKLRFQMYQTRVVLYW